MIKSINYLTIPNYLGEFKGHLFEKEHGPCTMFSNYAFGHGWKTTREHRTTYKHFSEVGALANYLKTR